MKIKDIVTFVSKSITPQKGVTYNLYSLPSFDEGKTFEVLDGADIQSNKYDVPNKCILFNKLNVRFKRVWRIDSHDENKIASTEFLPLVVDEDVVDFQYCYYLLISDKITNYLCGQNTNTSGSHKRIDPDNFLNIEIKLPKMSIQRQIGKTLSALDRKIVLNKQINDNLETMAKQLYDYWFVQFDFPNEEGKPYKSSGGAMVWNENLKREIPQGWVVEKMGKCTNVLLGGTPDTNDNSLWGNGYNWLNSGEVAEFPILKSEKNITPKGLEKSATVLAPKGSVTLSITRHLRPSILCIDACINQSVVAILENDKVSKEYIYPLLNRDIPRLMSLRTGAQQPHINKETVEAINVILPPANIMGAYINIAESIYNAIFNNAKEVEELTKQRDELLPLLMNGQASVNYHLSDD
mgnify:FL=1